MQIPTDVPKNPVTVMWSHPRSMSTTIERVMRQRGDCFCMHEPFMYYYYIQMGNKEMPHFDVEQNRPTKFNDIIAEMYRQAERQPVFAKDMGYYIYPTIEQHPQLAHNLQHLFLIRDPRKTIISYFKLDPDFELIEGGLESQWNLYQWIKQQTGNSPLIVQAENIQQQPEQVIGNVWEYLGLPFIEEAFHWTDDDQVKDWHQVQQWHEKTLGHSKISVDARSEEQLDEDFAKCVANAPHLQIYLDHHQPYYEKLVAASITP